ncbi:(S)-benzoin forming benzil reductase [Bacillus sp. NPDC077027]|uniref:(S)-benzoin forming benzil reductase n=1 Tax=Bacillus sp. NPDC077027 TaxID=3390548 RepID=UPI003D04B6EE
MRISIVTGGSKGFGLALVKQLLARGDKVYSAARGKTPLAHTNLIHTQVDLTNETQAENWLKVLFQSLSFEEVEEVVLINNAGMVTPMKRAGEGERDMLSKHYTLNLIIPVILSHLFVELTRSLRGKKTLIQISSGAAKNPYKGWSAYCSSKAGLDMFMRTLHFEQQDESYPVRTFSFSPGTIDTDMQADIRRSSKNDFEQIERFQTLHETGALKSPDEVAEILLELMATDVAGGEVYDAREYANKQS